MFTKRERKPTKLDEIIDELQTYILSTTPDDDDYEDLVARLETLYKMKEQEAPDRISANTKAIIAANIAGIVLILGFEKANVVTSKALSFIMKLK